MSVLTVGELHTVVCIMKGKETDGELQQSVTYPFLLSVERFYTYSAVYTVALCLAMHLYIYFTPYVSCWGLIKKKNNNKYVLTFN